MLFWIREGGGSGDLESQKSLEGTGVKINLKNIYK